MTRGSEFGVFANAEAVRFLVVPQEFSRAELDRLEEVAKEWGAKGLAYIVTATRRRGPLADREVPLGRGARRVRGAARLDRALRRRATRRSVARVLGGLRLHLARELGLAEPTRDVFHWVIDFPLFERDEDTGNWTFLHHPFTAPIAGDEDFEGDPGAAKSQHYDLIWNGWELGSGSIRIHRSELQAAVFRVMGMSDEEAQAKFGFLLDALEMGAPPHGGLRDGARAVRRADGRRAGHPPDRRVPEGLERLRSADRRADADAAGGAAGARNRGASARGRALGSPPPVSPQAPAAAMSGPAEEAPAEPVTRLS